MIAICLSGINPLNFSTLLGVNDKQKASSRNLDKTHLMTVYFNYQYKFHHHSNTFQTVRRRAKGIKFGLYPPVYFLDRLVRITFKLQNDLLMTSEFAVDEGKQRPPRKAFASRSTGVVFFLLSMVGCGLHHADGQILLSGCRKRNRFCDGPAVQQFISATATSLTLVPVGPVTIKPPTACSAW